VNITLPSKSCASFKHALAKGPPAFAREASEGCHAEAQRAKAGARFASYGSASHPAIINGKDSRKADAALASN